MSGVFFLAILSLVLRTVDAQQCQGTFNGELTGRCSPVGSCQGTLLAGNSCGQNQCCINGTSPASTSACLNTNDFYVLYNTSRALYLQAWLNRGINTAGICGNCQAKAAFLAVAAAMTNHFQTDEATGTADQFAKDDFNYGNNQTGDGSRYRRRGFFGLRGKAMYARLDAMQAQYQSVSNPEGVALVPNAIEIASLLWRSPDLQTASSLSLYADGTFYGFSMLWYRLNGEMELLPAATKYYSMFLRQLQCGGDLYPGQGPVCAYNSTHQGSCSADCIRGLEEAGEVCGCSGGNKGSQCPDSPAHVRCCLDTCTQELKLDLGFVLDASGSIGFSDYQLQRNFTKNLLAQVNVGRNKSHVGIINFSTTSEVLTWLNTDYELQQKLQSVDRAEYFSGTTNTAAALEQAATVFSSSRGLRPTEEGAVAILFVITDGDSDDRTATIRAAQALKSKGLTLVSVGVGLGPDLVELHSICTPPASENYFAISNYAGLNQKINQFASRSCSEPAPLPSNITVTEEVGKDKYKFLKVEIVSVGNQILIRVKLLNGKVKIFHSFTSRNPKDPADFGDYQSKASSDPGQSLWTEFFARTGLISRTAKAEENELTLFINRTDSTVGHVYLGLKGVEEENKFEVKFDDCAKTDCTLQESSSSTKPGVMLFTVLSALFLFSL